jgi:hypothetical protein
MRMRAPFSYPVAAVIWTVWWVEREIKRVAK